MLSSAGVPWGAMASDLFGFCVGAAVWAGGWWFFSECAKTKPKPEPFNKRRRRY